jgi:histone H3/H4
MEEQQEGSAVPPLRASRASVQKVSSRNSPAIKAILVAYCARQLLAITNRGEEAYASSDLPLARIKRIMKQDASDPTPRMIAAETVPVVAYAVQLFIGSISSLAWQISTKPAGRNTLQVKDLKAAVLASSQFDFLIDVLDMFDQQMEQAQGKGVEPTTREDLSVSSGPLGLRMV